LGTELWQVGVTNGSELFRKLIQKLDPPRADSAFHLANEIRGLGGVSVCKDFAMTVRFVKFLTGKMLDYTTETGSVFPDADAARVFSQAVDEDTMGRIDDHEDLNIEKFEPIKDWILQREVKLRLRKNTRSGKGKTADDMVYGVEPKIAESPPQPPTSDTPPSVDPWHSAASAADPWAASPGLPGAAAAASDAAWPDPSAAWTSYMSPEYGGDIDAFGKGKGKGKDSGPRPPLECYNCLGSGHPQQIALRH
jgi:hypothetical protein